MRAYRPAVADGACCVGLVMDKSEFKVGQVLFWEWSSYTHRRRENEDVTITKIGRKWLELSNGYRVDKETLVADCGKYSPAGRCYLDRAAREEELRVQNAWRDLNRRMGYSVPSGVSADDIEQAAKLLGLSK